MKSVDWPLRLVPRRSPSFGYAALVFLSAILAAVAVRMLLLGLGSGFALSATYFPAMVVVTLFAGARWGWAALTLAVGLSAISPSVFTQGAAEALILLFGLSGAITVLAASALRESLLRLDEANRRQRSVQEALDRTEARLRLAQEAGDVGLWDWDVVSGAGHWSPALFRNIGLDSSLEPDVRRLLQQVHPEDRERVRQVNLTAIREGRMDPVEYRVVWPDGSVHWLLSRGEMIRDETGRVVRALGVNIDVTEKHLAEQQIRESEARFRALADSAPIIMWVSRDDGTREFVNRAYLDFLGASFSYDDARAFDWRKRLHEDDLPRILREQVAGEASRQLFTLEARYRNADEAWRWLRSVSQPRYGPAGDFIGFIGIAIDVTDAKRAEQDLKRINELLAERVAAALTERDQAETALRRAQKLEAVGQLTGGVAHDFNNLLTVIIGALDLIQRRPGDEDRRERMIEAALGAARRGERLTSQLLAFSRRQALKPELVCVDQVLRESEPLLRRAVGEAVELIVAPACPDSHARIDPAQFEAAVMNLVVNARDATHDGGAIRLETQHCELAAGQVEEIEPGAYVCLSVHDTGVGMDAETMACVFEPFFTTKEVGKGTGLGLSQVYGFARQSGGGASIESTLGKGSTVRLYLPRAAAAGEVELEAEPAQPAVPSGPRLDVLLVEDDAQVGDMVQAMLEDLGHRVSRAADVADGLAVVHGPAPIDLLLTDLVMPGGRNGVDLARDAVSARPGLPVILSSGYTGEALAAAAGAPWPLLRKPYSAEALARVIEAVVEPQTAPA